MSKPAPSRDHIETIVRQFHESWDLRDPDRGAFVIADDCHFEDVARGEYLGGKAGYIQDYHRWRTAFPDGEVKVVRVIIEGDWAVVEFLNGPIGRFVRRIPLRWNNVGTAKFLLFLGSVCKLLILLYRAVLRLVRRSFRPQRDFAVLRPFLDREAVFPVSCPAIWPPESHLLSALKSACVQNVRWPRRHGRSIRLRRT